MSSSGEIVEIDSKNQVDEEDAAQLEHLIQNQEVILSHSTTMQLQEHCRGIVEEFEYEKKSLKVRVSSETGYSIWEDTDIWMFSLSTPASTVCTSEPNTSADTEPPPPDDDSSKPTSPFEMSQTELFESINGWKLIDQKRLRMRRKENGRWRNVYLVELVLTCVEPEKQELLAHVQKRTSLRLSVDIEEPGMVLVDVIKKCVEDGKQKTITIGVTGFLSRDVDMPLTPETTFYLNIHDVEDDDVGSMASEEGILPGFPLVQNLDELCEKIGELTITDVCARLWYTDNTELCYIRLLVTSLKNMSNFKKLTGHHVIVTSLTNDGNRTHVLGVVNRVFSEEMVLTLKAVPKHSKEFFFSKKEGFTIQIAHEYEDRLLHEKSHVERLRFDLANSSSDIRFERYWRETINEHSRNYALFTVKNEEFLRIPMGTKLILGKCYGHYAPVEKKADFGIVRRAKHVLGNAEMTLVLELINTKHLVEDADKFKANQGYYYIDFDSVDDIRKDSNIPKSNIPSQRYCLLNARNAKDSETSSLAKSSPMGRELKFYVFPFDEKFQAKNQKKKKIQQLKAKKSDPDSLLESLVNNNNPPIYNLPIKKFSSQRQIVEDSTTHPEDPLPPNTVNSGNELWKPLQPLPSKARIKCFVQIPDPNVYGKGNAFLDLQTGFDEHGETRKTAPFPLGSQIAITAGVGEKEIRIRGEVNDTKGKTVTIQLDRQLSDMEFLSGLKKKASNKKNQKSHHRHQKPVYPCFEVR